MVPSGIITDYTSLFSLPSLTNSTSPCSCKVHHPPLNSPRYSSTITSLVLFLPLSFPLLSYYPNIHNSVLSPTLCLPHLPTPLFTYQYASILPISNCLTPSLRTGPHPSLNGSDTPMWAPDSIPPFSGAYPFIRHIQFWLFMHITYQEAYTLPPCPYVFLHFLTPGQTSNSPAFYFCINNGIPSPEHLLTFVCPHVFVFDTHRDINMEYYGVVVARPSSLYADLDAAALEAKPITYP